MRSLRDERFLQVYDISCDLCEAVIGTERPNAMGTPTNNLSDGVITITTGVNDIDICESCRYAGAEQHLTKQHLKIQVGQDFDAETWHNVKQHFNAGELLTAEIEVGDESEAVLVWTFDLDKAHARKLAVMLEMVAGLGKPQTGLDMKPSKREMFK